jgi:hypothetical protein
MPKHIIYKCGYCGNYHPWEFNGDCNDYQNSFRSPEEYAVTRIGFDARLSDITVRTQDDRDYEDANELWESEQG